MVDHDYEQGTIKVVWVENDPARIYSKMFDTEHDAELFGKTKADYVIFALTEQKEMEEFSWKLLPYGRYKLYTSLVKTLHVDRENLIKQVKNVLPL